ncbi:MAG TPA: zf-HC2 domain-containing protein [Magnetospirillaceae bacterium]|jgi:anti-sigma factor RsiW
MACDKTLLVHAYLDGELDPAAALQFDSHLGACAECQAALANATEIRDALRASRRRHIAPSNLTLRIAAALDAVDAETMREPNWFARLGRFVATRRQWFAGAISGVAAAAAVAIALVVLLPSDDDDRVVDELANAHLRSLMPAHLLDVSSSDEKTVAPWFKAQVETAPPVFDFHAQGFDLEGGRTDVIDGRRVAVVVYRHDDHVVNLFVWSDYELDHASAAARAGYNLFMWPQRHLALCAVSDISVTDLKTLAHSVNAGMAARND